MVGVVADHPLGMAVNPVDPRRAISSGGDDVVERRMPIDRREATSQSPRRDRGDVVDEPLGCQLGQLDRHVAADRDEVIALGSKDSVKHPVFMRPLIEHLFTGGRVNRPQGVVGAAKGDELAVGRPAAAVDRVEADWHRQFKRACFDVPDLDLAHSRRVAAGDQQPAAVGREPHPLDPFGEANQPLGRRGRHGGVVGDRKEQHLMKAGDRQPLAIGGKVDARHNRLPGIDRRVIPVDFLASSCRRVILGTGGNPAGDEVHFSFGQRLAGLGHLGMAVGIRRDLID